MAFSGGDSWLSSYDACEALAREIMEKITLRNQQQKNSSQYSQVNAKARQLMKKYSSDVQTLRDNLIKASSFNHITQREMERRERMLDNLGSKELQIEAAFNDREQGSVRNALLGADFSDRTQTSWGIEETDDTKDLTVQELKMQQQITLEEQDQGLDGLYNIVVRQKQMAYDIGDELTLQNDIIDDIVDHTDRTRDRLIKETRHVNIVDRKANTCGYWIAIVLLLIAIIVIVSVPYHK